MNPTSEAEYHSSVQVRVFRGMKCEGAAVRRRAKVVWRGRIPSCMGGCRSASIKRRPPRVASSFPFPPLPPFISRR